MIKHTAMRLSAQFGRTYEGREGERVIGGGMSWRMRVQRIAACLGGAAAWIRADEPFTSQPTGTVIHHPSWMLPMRTNSKSLMAWYVWRGGDLTAKSKIIAPS